MTEYSGGNNNYYSNTDEELYTRFITEMERGSRNEEQEDIEVIEEEEDNNPRRNDLYNRLLHNLLYLDYIFMLVTLPMTIYTIISVTTNVITFDYSDSPNDEDIFIRIVKYFKYRQLSTRDSKTGMPKFIEKYVISTEDPQYNDIINELGLLGKFHKTVNQYTRSLQNMKYYHMIIKILTTSIYLMYGFIGSSYMILLNLFFTLCLVLTIYRRYKDVVEIIIRQFC